MATKGKNNWANMVPFWVADSIKASNTASTANSTTAHGVTVFGVNSANTTAKGYVHPGWNLKTLGTGPVATMTPTVPGTGYANGNLVRVSGATVNAIGTVVTNGAGAITSVVITTPGSGFMTIGGATIAVVNSTFGATGVGSGATVTITLGGRAGRKQVECLVAMKSMTANGAGGEYTNL